jgi:phosphoglycolate phosphatase-like HAD superfamily hydrolase
MRSLVLFDIDGTLVLTGGAGVRAMSRAFEEVFAISAAFTGIPMAGRTDQIIIMDALARHDLAPAPDAMDSFRDRYYAALRSAMEEDAPRKGVLPGVRELLDRLSVRSDVVVGLLTGNFAEGARIKLEYFGLWRYFACGAFGDDAIDRNHLVPVAIDRVKTVCGPSIPADRVTVIGDTILDVACARAGGARAIAVATGPHDVATLEASGADLVLGDLSDTNGVLQALNGRWPREDARA